jgi:protease-4
MLRLRDAVITLRLGRRCRIAFAPTLGEPAWEMGHGVSYFPRPWIAWFGAVKPILSSLLFGVWAIDQERSVAFLPEVKRLLEGTSEALSPEQLKMFRAAHEPMLMNGDGEEMNGNDLPENERFVMVLPIRGAILRDDVECGPYGMETRAKWLRRADGDPRIVGVVLDCDSPGGQGDGMRIMAQQLKRMKKPVVTYVNNGLACSAMMGIAAATKEIILSGESDLLGSIGTYMTIPDMKRFYKDEFHLLLHEVYATTSTKKNRPFLEALKADPENPDDAHYKLLREQIIDPFNQSFIAHVKECRPQVKDIDGVFNGEVFFGNDAIRVGLADGYGTLDTAIDRVRQLSMSNSQPKTSQQSAGTSNPTNNTNMKFPERVLAFVAGLFSDKEEVTAENLLAANEKLAENGLSNVVLMNTADAEAAKDSAAKVNAAIAAKTTAEAARDEANSAKTAAETAQGAAEAKLADVEAGLNALLTELKIETKEGSSALETVANALKAATTKVGEQAEEIATLKNEHAPNGKPASATRGGDNQEEESEEIQAANKETANWVKS